MLILGIWAIAILTIANVLMRSLWGGSIEAAEEWTQFVIIAICFVGMSYAAGQARHIRMTAFYDSAPARIRKKMMLTAAACTSLLMFIFCWYATEYVATVYQLQSVFPATRIPCYLIYLAAPIGFALAGTQYLLTLIANLTNDDVHLSYHATDTPTTGASLPPADLP